MDDGFYTYTVGKIYTSSKQFFGPLQRPKRKMYFGIVCPHNLDIRFFKWGVPSQSYENKKLFPRPL